MLGTRFRDGVINGMENTQSSAHATDVSVVMARQYMASGHLQTDE